MAITNVQVDIGSGNYSSIYVTKVLQPKQGKYLTQDMVLEPNTKYVVKYILDLNKKLIRLPENCIIEIDGGQLKNGTLIGNETILLNSSGVTSIFNNIVQAGTWQYKEGSIAGPQGPAGRDFTYEDLTEEQKTDLVQTALSNIIPPDISVTPTEMSQTFNGNTVYQVLLPALDTTKILGNYFDVQEPYFNTNNLPQNSIILEAFVFNDTHLESAQCIYRNNYWSIYGSNSDFSPEYALIRYYLKNEN